MHKEGRGDARPREQRVQRPRGGAERGGLGQQGICLTRRGDRQFCGASTNATLGRGCGSVPLRNPSTCPLPPTPQASWPGPLPQLRTGTLGPRAVVCSQDHQVAPSSFGFVPRGWDRVPPRLWSVVSYGGAFQGPWRATGQGSEQETDSGQLGGGILSKNLSSGTSPV